MDVADAMRTLFFGGILLGFLLLLAGTALGRAWLLALGGLVFFAASVPGMTSGLGVFVALLGVFAMAGGRLIAGEPEARWSVARAGGAVLAALLAARLLHVAAGGTLLPRPNAYEPAYVVLVLVAVLLAWLPVTRRPDSDDDPARRGRA